MKNLHPTILAALDEPTIQVFFVIDIVSSSAVVRETTLSSPVTIGGLTYTPNSKIVSVDRLRMESRITRDTYELVMSDLSRNLENLFGQDIVGGDLRVRVGVIDQFTGAPNLDHFFTAYQGRVGAFTVVTDDESTLLQITGVSTAGNLSFKRTRYTSRSNQRSIDPTDSSMDLISTGTGPQTAFNWGR
jgi:hypothetical protein